MIFAKFFAVAITVSTVAAQSPCDPAYCSCPTVNQPVCGTNRRTYSSFCHLMCVARCYPTLQMAHSGPCECNPSCACTQDNRPVCGSDRITYPNKCVLECEKKCNSGLHVAYEGKCK